MARVNYYCRSPGGVQAEPRHALRVAGVSSHLHDGGDECEPRTPFLSFSVSSFFYSTLSLARVDHHQEGLSCSYGDHSNALRV